MTKTSHVVRLVRAKAALVMWCGICGAGEEEEEEEERWNEGLMKGWEDR